jgi:hypothetical protein
VNFGRRNETRRARRDREQHRAFRIGHLSQAIEHLRPTLGYHTRLVDLIDKRLVLDGIQQIISRLMKAAVG